MSNLDDLLTIQELDTNVDQLLYRRANLAQLAERADLARARSAAVAVADATSVRLHSLRSDQKENEDHASLLEDKASEVQASLYDGSVTSHKELESLQAELVQLKQRQADFEDRAIELMEEAEPVESELDQCSASIAAVDAEIERVDAEIVVARAEIDVEVERVRGERAALTGGVPSDMLEAYEPLRTHLGGIAVARLSGARCEGCHLEIPSAQLEAVRRAPADALVTCPECLRILVR